MRLFFHFIIASFALLASGCVYQGNDTNLLERKLSWYSYLNGDDIRPNCFPGSADRMRLIYNAVYTEQVRTYEIEIRQINVSGTQGIRMRSRVLKPANIPDIGFSNLQDFLTPWRGEETTVWLRDSDLVLLWGALNDSQAFAPAPRGMRLAGDNFFWLTSLCRDGVFSFNAWKWPSDSFDALTFDELLFVWDMNDTPVNQPRRIMKSSIYNEPDQHGLKRAGRYRMSIGENGLKEFWEE